MSIETPDEPETGRGTRVPDAGGEAVCWLPRVCDECGQLADHDPPASCPACGASIP